MDNHVQIATTCFSPFYFPGSFLTNQIWYSPTPFPMGRDSRSLSRKRRHSEQHDRHRSRSIRRQSRRMSDRSHRNRSPSQDRQDIPSTWKSSSSHYDVNQVYGLSLPRTVESTQWSRKANLVGVPVDQVKVVDVIPGGMSNWGLTHWERSIHCI